MNSEKKPFDTFAECLGACAKDLAYLIGAPEGDVLPNGVTPTDAGPEHVFNVDGWFRRGTFEWVTLREVQIVNENSMGISMIHPATPADGKWYWHFRED